MSVFFYRIVLHISNHHFVYDRCITNISIMVILPTSTVQLLWKFLPISGTFCWSQLVAGRLLFQQPKRRSRKNGRGGGAPYIFGKPTHLGGVPSVFLATVEKKSNPVTCPEPAYELAHPNGCHLSSGLWIQSLSKILVNQIQSTKHP